MCLFAPICGAASCWLFCRLESPVGVFFFFKQKTAYEMISGVQTCALPISTPPDGQAAPDCCRAGRAGPGRRPVRARSEERRVGKSVDLGGRRIIKKKKERQISPQRYE